MLKSFFALLALASFSTPSCSAAYATAVVEYISGSGFASGFTDSTRALGEPSRTTPGTFGGPVDPFNPPFLSGQLVSIGAGGSLTLRFDLPILDNPTHLFGLDFIVFGNNGFTITNNDFSGSGITDGSLFTFDPPGASRVLASANGSDYYELDPPTALTPVVDGLFPTDGNANFHLPVNPNLRSSDFAGQDLGEIRALYGGSAGGTGYDLRWARAGNGDSVLLASATYIRIETLSGKVEIDGVAAVPEPSAALLILLGAGLFVPVGRWLDRRTL